jgi:hypothetical protein
MKPVKLEKRLGSGWKRTEGDIFGEYDVYNYLYTILGDEPAALTAAAGWGVGWISIYERENTAGEFDTMVHIALEWDSSSDWREFSLTYGRLIDVAAGDPARVHYTPGESPICWEAGNGFGFFSWDAHLQRNDIILATNASAIDLATRGVLSTTSADQC